MHTLHITDYNYSIMNKKIIQQKIIEAVNLETGSIATIESEKVFYLPKEPSYIKLYFDDIAKIYGLPSSNAMFELLKQMNYEGQIILNSTTKKIICERVKFKSVYSLNNYLSQLVKKGVFKNVGRGVYQPNPNLFGRGDWKSIYKLREAWIKIGYDKEGNKVIKGSLSEQC